MENSGLEHMIRNNKFDEISLMHYMFSRVPESFTLLSQQLSAYITATGSKLVQDDQIKTEEFVTQIVLLRRKVIDIYNKSFNKDPKIDVAIKQSFEGFINLNDRCARYLVFYLDEKFKKDFKMLSEAEVSEELDKILQIFRYLQDKDVFEGFYKVSLAKRLLEQKSANEDAEKMMVLMLKEECGFSFT